MSQSLPITDLLVTDLLRQHRQAWIVFEVMLRAHPQYIARLFVYHPSQVRCTRFPADMIEKSWKARTRHLQLVYEMSMCDDLRLATSSISGLRAAADLDNSSMNLKVFSNALSATVAAP